MGRYVQEEEGDDEPRPEVDAERRVELGRVEHAVGDVRVDDAGAGDEDRPERHPEAAVHRERCVEQIRSQYQLDATYNNADGAHARVEPCALEGEKNNGSGEEGRKEGKVGCMDMGS